MACCPKHGSLADFLFHLSHFECSVLSFVPSRLPFQAAKQTLSNFLFTHVATDVVRSPISEVPRSPTSSSVSTAGRNSTLSLSKTPRLTNQGVRKLSSSKTAIFSQSSTLGGKASTHPSSSSFLETSSTDFFSIPC